MISALLGFSFQLPDIVMSSQYLVYVALCFCDNLSNSLSSSLAARLEIIGLVQNPVGNAPL